MKGLLASLLHILYPPRCLACNAPGEGGEEPFCPHCLAALRGPVGPGCRRCGEPGPAGPEGCRLCAGLDPALERLAWAVILEGTAERMVHLLKYRSWTSLAGPMAARMVRAALSQLDLSVCDCIVPVPLHPVRRRERGYNQSELLARPLGEALGLPVRARWVRRRRGTRPQVGLPAGERRRNVEGAFGVPRPAALQGAGVLIVDDVLTTGATLSALAAALAGAGAGPLQAVTFARAPLSAVEQEGLRRPERGAARLA